MDTKKLRQKILDLAIHGKLVPQDPNDEPASVLLERIKAEKEQLIKEGKIKRQKKSTSSDTSHYGNDVPFEVPKGWVWCRLGDVFSHNTGKALNSSNKEGENLTYITTSNVYWDRFELNDLKKMPFTNSELEKCTVSKGDLLVCEGGDIGRSAIWNFDYDIRIQNHIHRLRPITEANVHFYYYVLMYNKQAGLIGGKGIGLMGLSSGELDKMIVPLPPIKEQCRITKEIEKLFAIVSLIEEDESDLKNAIQKAKSTILDLALSGRLTSHTSHYPQLPDGWKEVRLGDICRLISGTSYSKNDIRHNGIRILRGGNIQHGKVLLLDNDVYISTSLHNKEYSLMKGDIIIVASTGSFDLIGKAGYIEQDIPNAQIGAFLRIVRPIDSSISQYLRLIFESALYKSHIQDLAKGTNINNIKASYITDFCIPLPPMGEQKKICNIVKIIFQQLDDIESSMVK